MLNHCEHGDYHAEAISSMPLPTFTSRGLDSAAERDAARFHWLCADHDSAATRHYKNALLSRMSVMSYSAACVDIDAAIAAMQPKGK